MVRISLRFCLFALMLACVMSSPVSALIGSHETGIWPKDWPTELEAYRARSSTGDFVADKLERVYCIPVNTREEFEVVWLAVQKVRSPNGTLTLLPAMPKAKVQDQAPKIQQPKILITAPTHGAVLSDPISSITPQTTMSDLEAHVATGNALKVGSTWGENLTGPKGELPEYVGSQRGADGRLEWVDVSSIKSSGPVGFSYRARVDLSLVVDGKVIDLNQIKLPHGITVIDKRFD